MKLSFSLRKINALIFLMIPLAFSVYFLRLNFPETLCDMLYWSCHDILLRLANEYCF
jgi:hypothetical protein